MTEAEKAFESQWEANVSGVVDNRPDLWKVIAKSWYLAGRIDGMNAVITKYEPTARKVAVATADALERTWDCEREEAGDEP